MDYREAVEVMEAFEKRLDEALEKDAPMLLTRDEVRVIKQALNTTAL